MIDADYEPVNLRTALAVAEAPIPMERSHEALG